MILLSLKSIQDINVNVKIIFLMFSPVRFVSLCIPFRTPTTLPRPRVYVPEIRERGILDRVEIQVVVPTRGFGVTGVKNDPKVVSVIINLLTGTLT